MRRRGVVLAFALLLGCDGGPASYGDELEVRIAEGRWAAAVTDGYSYTLRRECFFCHQNPLRVTVRGDSVVSVVELPGPNLPTPALASVSYTVEELFDQARRVMTNRDLRSTVEFDPVHGYPSLISWYQPRTLDSGYALIASDVVFEDH